MRIVTPTNATGNTASRKPVDMARSAVNTHTVPSTVPEPIRRSIVGSLEAGRSIAQTSKAHNCTHAVAIEFWMRARNRRAA